MINLIKRILLIDSYNFSVNVFLGLGLPWVIRTCYYLVNGGAYRVNTDALDFSVILFDSLGAVCVIGLVFRYVLSEDLQSTF